MDPHAVCEKLKTIHRDVEADCGHDPSRVTDDVMPIDGLGGFDSPSSRRWFGYSPRYWES